MSLFSSSNFFFKFSKLILFDTSACPFPWDRFSKQRSTLLHTDRKTFSFFLHELCSITYSYLVSQTEPTDDIFLNKLYHVYLRYVVVSFCFYPLGEIICCYQSITLSRRSGRQDFYYLYSPMIEWSCTQNTLQLPRWYMRLMSESLAFITASGSLLHHLWPEVSL